MDIHLTFNRCRIRSSGGTFVDSEQPASRSNPVDSCQILLTFLTTIVGLNVCLFLRSFFGPNAERGQATARTIHVHAGLRHSTTTAHQQCPDVVQSADIGQSTKPGRRRRWRRFESYHTGNCHFKQRTPAGFRRCSDRLQLMRSSLVVDASSNLHDSISTLSEAAN